MGNNERLKQDIKRLEIDLSKLEDNIQSTQNKIEKWKDDIAENKKDVKSYLSLLREMEKQDAETIAGGQEPTNERHFRKKEISKHLHNAKYELKRDRGYVRHNNKLLINYEQNKKELVSEIKMLKTELNSRKPEDENKCDKPSGCSPCDDKKGRVKAACNVGEIVNKSVQYLNTLGN